MKNKRGILFWGTNILEGIGMTAGAAAFLLLFFGMGGMWGTGNMTELLFAGISLYPWYLLIVGVFISLILSIAYFQTYYSVLLSMNVTRKQIVRDIFLCMAVTMAGILLLAALIWYLVPGDISEGGRTLLPQITGCYLILCSLFLIMGTLVLRFGTIGSLIMAAVFVLLGMAAGIFTAMSEGGLLEAVSDALQNLVIRFGKSSPMLLLTGALLYLATCFLSYWITRNQEVRA